MEQAGDGTPERRGRHLQAAGFISRAVEIVVVVMFAVVFVTFCVKIGLRYAVGDAAAWADELSVAAFIWIVFLANGFVVADRRQIAFDLIHRNLSAGGQRVVEIARTLLIGGIFAASLPAVIDYTLFLWREKTPVLRWRLDILYSCFALFMVALLVRMAWALVGPGGLLRRRAETAGAAKS